MCKYCFYPNMVSSESPQILICTIFFKVMTKSSEKENFANQSVCDIPQHSEGILLSDLKLSVSLDSKSLRRSDESDLLPSLKTYKLRHSQCERDSRQCHTHTHTQTEKHTDGNRGGTGERM